MNAWEEKGKTNGDVDIVCELVELPDADVLELLVYEFLSSSEAATARPVEEDRDVSINLVRHRLQSVPATGDSKSQSVSPTKKTMSIPAGELPRINPDYTLKAHRYVYSTLNRGKSSFMDGIGKTDTQAGTTMVWEQDRHTPGEAIFLPRPGATEEDDGVILSVVFDGDSGKSYLLCLEASSMKEVARASVAGPVPLGLHGLHMPTRN